MKTQGKKNRVKGMTLVEIIIAMLVLSIAGLIMVRVGQTSTSIMKNTNHLNNRNNVQIPVAAVRDVEAIKDTDGSFYDPTEEIHFNVGTITDPTDTHVNPVYGSYSGKKYSTKHLAEDEALNAKTNVDQNIDFYIVDEPTEPTTTP